MDLLVDSHAVFTTAHDQYMRESDLVDLVITPQTLWSAMARLDNKIIAADESRKNYRYRALEDQMMEIGAMALAIATSLSRRNEMAA